MVAAIWKGHGGRMTRQEADAEGDVSGDVALTRRMTQAEAEVVSGSGCTTFSLEWFQGRGICHTREGDAWREYGKNTAHLPDSKLLHVGRWESPPTTNLWGRRSYGW